MKRAIILASALIAAPLSFAQTNPQQTPPATTAAPTTTPPPNTQPPPSEPTTPAQPATTTAAPASSSTAAPQGCRTRKAVGEACACLSDTSRIGASTAHPDGHNVCVRPD